MYNSKKYKVMADKSAEKERLFNEWFTKSYDRLRGTLRRYGMLDEDNFHDTYLFVRRQVLVPGKDITDYDAYFIGCYKKAALIKIKRENRYAHPEDDFFLRMWRGGKIPFRGRPERVRAAGKRHTAFRKAEVLLRGIPDVHAQVL